MITRSRTGAVHCPVEFTSQQYSNGTPTSGHNQLYPYRDLAQVTASEGHPVHLLGKTLMDIGGPFETRKLEVIWTGWKPQWIRGASKNAQGVWANEYFTVLLPNSAVAQVATANRQGLLSTDTQRINWVASRVPTLYSASELDARGTRIIDSVVPTNPVVDLSMSIGEFLSERKLFSVPGTSGSVPGEYLNYMFGIAPLVSDVQDLRRAISDQEKIIEQYERDSGRLVRRQYRPDPETSVTQTISSGFPATYGPGLSTAVARSGQLTTTTRTSVQWKFSGAFTYLLPTGGTWRKLSELDKLYGVVPGSALAWELVPYSWLVDYKLSMGSMLRNIDSFSQNSLVMPYAYITAVQTVEKEYTWIGEVRNDVGDWVKRHLTAVVQTRTLQRRPATPFGFGIDPGSLTSQQVSIIAALGLTKLDK